MSDDEPDVSPSTFRRERDDILLELCQVWGTTSPAAIAKRLKEPQVQYEMWGYQSLRNTTRQIRERFEKWASDRRTETIATAIARAIEGRQHRAEDRRRPSAKVLQPGLLEERLNERYSLLKAEIFAPISEFIRRPFRPSFPTSPDPSLDFSVKLSVVGVEDRTLFKEGLLHLQRRIPVSGLVESLNNTAETADAWNTKAGEFVRRFDEVAVRRLADNFPLADRPQIPPWLPGTLCVPYALLNLHAWWFTIALAKDRPTPLVNREWPSVSEAETWLTEGGIRVNQWVYLSAPVLSLQKPWVRFGGNGIVELGPPEAERDFARLAKVLADLIAVPEILSGLADLSTERQVTVQNISQELSRFEPIAAELDRMCEEIRVGYYRDACELCPK